MSSGVLNTYVTTNRVIGFESQLLVDLILQGISMVILIVFYVFIIRLCILGIKALKIYIKKNSQ